MKVRILAPEVTIGDKKYLSGKEVSVPEKHDREVVRLQRSGYVLILDGDDATDNENPQEG